MKKYLERQKEFRDVVRRAWVRQLDLISKKDKEKKKEVMEKANG